MISIPWAAISNCKSKKKPISLLHYNYTFLWSIKNVKFTSLRSLGTLNNLQQQLIWCSFFLHNITWNISSFPENISGGRRGGDIHIFSYSCMQFQIEYEYEDLALGHNTRISMNSRENSRQICILVMIQHVQTIS